jgi:ABC-2 type transport system permease protein
VSVPQLLRNVLQLGLKELVSFRRDRVMVVLLAFSFTYGVYAPAKGARMEVRDCAVGFVDEDGSQLSLRIRDALLAPQFKPPEDVSVSEIDDGLDRGRFTIVVDVPPHFERDVRRGRDPTVQVLVDATAMTQAGQGVAYVAQIIASEVARQRPAGAPAPSPARLVVRTRFNPNLESSWFAAMNHLVGSITMLGLLLGGAALVREREHGTLEHLLVLPLRPVEVLLAKVWSTAVVVMLPATLCLEGVVRGRLDVPVTGSVPLFVLGATLYTCSITMLGIMLATIARSMPQFGLLFIPVHDVLNLLSGGTTPLDSMPRALQHVMALSPTTHFVSFAQAILYRGAGLEVVWPELLAIVAIGIAFFAVALIRLRRTLAVVG